jgi:16S rRNA (adenine1518-N6/adenine1519-N6)-dimethyltransferase
MDFSQRLANAKNVAHFAAMALLKQTLLDLKNLGIFPSKRLSQNFLIDGNVVDMCAEGIEPGEKIVEIGPGLGAISEKILRGGAELFAVEIDPRLFKFLGEKFANFKNFHLQCADGVKFPTGELPPDTANFRVIANLPYAISSPWMGAILELKNLPRAMTLILQTETAQKFFARAKTGEFCAMSIFLQSSYAATSMQKISPPSFYPKPAVSSTILSMARLENPFIFKAQTRRTIVKIFTKRRKQIFGIVKNEGAKLRSWLQANEIPPSARPEEIPTNLWQRLDLLF